MFHHQIIGRFVTFFMCRIVIRVDIEKFTAHPLLGFHLKILVVSMISAPDLEVYLEFCLHV